MAEMRNTWVPRCWRPLLPDSSVSSLAHATYEAKASPSWSLPQSPSQNYNAEAPYPRGTARWEGPGSGLKAVQRRDRQRPERWSELRMCRIANLSNRLPGSEKPWVSSTGFWLGTQGLTPRSAKVQGPPRSKATQPKRGVNGTQHNHIPGASCSWKAWGV